MKLFFTCGVVLSTFFLLFGCSFFSHQSPRYVQLAANITEKTAERLKEQKNLHLIGTGGKMMDDIQAMDMSFHFYQEVDLKKARDLMAYAVNEYLVDINNSEEIRPYLHEYPFTAKNVEIRIWIYEPNGTNPPLDKICYISSINGILTYYLDFPEKHTIQAIYKETYEDAIQAMQ
jgi:hypothetical protein